MVFIGKNNLFQLQLSLFWQGKVWFLDGQVFNGRRIDTFERSKQKKV